ncbi:hypothetical protein [uncultured Tenacibaculum sp.]|uniref:hypothetical protein n=1 Tax=uncultured Tenacibaculum sp. TaxID=174713 RepID=UPI0026273D4D|nr:hypothetical protein [uncultured Tenacibaculum sp.]
MNARLRKDLNSFLSSFYKFERVKLDNSDELAIVGTVDVVDEIGVHWKSYKIVILLNEENYPNIIPKVFELTDIIERDWDYHVSKKGYCCLDIPHKLIKQKRRGINLTEFYKNVIYPFFANHQFKLAKGSYANGEYEHYDKGIIQFYKEEFGLIDVEVIIKHIELAVGEYKAEPNRECPICGKPKYKKCCKPISNSLLVYGISRLKSDLELFRKRADEILTNS